MILLDTNALIWLEQGHPRSRVLLEQHARLYVSPASLFELQILSEAGRIRLRDATVSSLSTRTDLWLLDDPPAARWFDLALDLEWTRDPFDRLLVAHARLRRWRLATADVFLLDKLSTGERLPV